MANACHASVQLCAVRAAILGPDGVPLPGSTNLYETDQFASITFNPEVRQGDEIEEANGCGDVVVSFRDCDREKWWNVTLELLTVDPELTELLAGGTVLSLSGDTRGYKVRSLRDASCLDGVSLELWTKRVLNGVQAADFPYWRWVLPKVKNLRINGDTQLGNQNAGRTFAGRALDNANWHDGPDNDWFDLADEEADEAWQYAMDPAIPSTQCGYSELVAS